jgi:hypothetical protein
MKGTLGNSPKKLTSINKQKSIVYQYQMQMLYEYLLKTWTKKSAVSIMKKSKSLRLQLRAKFWFVSKCIYNFITSNTYSLFIFQWDFKIRIEFLDVLNLRQDYQQ